MSFSSGIDYLVLDLVYSFTFKYAQLKYAQLKLRIYVGCRLLANS